jgi:ribosomal protein S6--L-glutamate ligase
MVKKIGVIGTKGGWSSELLADTVERITGRRLLVEMNEVRLDMPSGRAMYDGSDLSRLDALIIKKIGARYSPDLLDRLELLRFLSERGVPIFSDPRKIMRVLDRLSCTVSLQLAGIPMPPTTVTESVEQALDAVEEYGEAVFKPLYTSKARGMTVIRRGDGMREAVEKYQRDNPIMYVQKTVPLDDKDLGVAFLGGEYLTTYARCKTGDTWNTTTASGGKYATFDPPQEIIDLARKAQDLFGLDYTTVDVALTDEGPYVFEVSAFGGFRGVRDTRDIDPASLYAEYVIDRISS